MIDDFLRGRETEARMNPKELKQRIMQFAVRVLKLADALPNKPSGRTIANQVAKCLPE